MFEFRSQHYVGWFEFTGIYHNIKPILKQGGRLGGVPLIRSKIVKVGGVSAGVQSLSVPFFEEVGIQIKKTRELLKNKTISHKTSRAQIHLTVIFQEIRLWALSGC